MRDEADTPTGNSPTRCVRHPTLMNNLDYITVPNRHTDGHKGLLRESGPRVFPVQR